METTWLGQAIFWFLLFGLLALELLVPLHRNPKEGKGRLVANFGLGSLNALLFVALPLSTVIAASWAQAHSLGVMNNIALPDPVVFAVTILLRSLAAYVLHVAAHRVPVLWRLHHVHHADTAVDLSTGFRHHPFELVFIAGAHAAVAVSLGFSVFALIVYEAAAISLTLWTHANVRLPGQMDRFAGLFLVTPALHHVHHSARPVETNSNFGELLTIWDRIFNTFRRVDQADLTKMPIGLGKTHDSDASNFVRQLASPFRIGGSGKTERG